MTLRVAHVLNSAGRGGVPQVAHALIRAADRDQVSPFLFHLKPGPGLIEADCPSASASGKGGKTGAMAELLDWLTVHRIDILHCHSFRPNLYARLAGAALRPALRIVAHYHNTYDDKWCDPQVLALERHLGRVTDARIAVSKAVAKHVCDRLELTPGRVDIIPNAIDPVRLLGADRLRGRAMLNVAPQARLIGLIGRVCRQKGQDTFVEAALQLLSNDPSLRFVMIGEIEDATLAQRLQARVSDAGYAEVIRLHGHAENVGDVLAALDVLAAPSRWEGFGLAILEAMWLGVPVVASNVDAIPDVTGGTAVLVSPDDPKDLSRALTQTLSCASDRRIMAAKNIASQRTWEASAAEVHVIYDRIMT